jgi:hypothetical protein
MHFAERHRLNKRGRAAVLEFYGLLELVGRDFSHCHVE